MLTFGRICDGWRKERQRSVLALAGHITEVWGEDDTDLNSTGAGTGNNGPQGTGLALSIK